MLGRGFLSVSFAVTALMCLIDSAQAHIQMSYPLPIRSPLNKAEANPDYDYTTPLASDGSNFPCKGYHKAAGLKATADFTVGQTYTMTTSGSAVHGGGSCQLSLSYDNGATFKVFQSMIGGCPLSGSNAFAIPEGAPAGQALFAWTWINQIGNREFYMNCAVVNISGGSGAGFNGPEIYKANLGIFGPTCKTPEGTDVVYPNPGPKVVYGGALSASSPVTNISGCPASNNAGGSGPAPAPAPAPAPVTTTKAPAAPTAPASTTKAPAPAPTGNPGTPGQVTVTVTATVTEVKTEYVTVTRAGGSRPSGKPTYERREEYVEVEQAVGNGCSVGQVICIDSEHVGVCVDGFVENAEDMGAIPYNTSCIDGQLVEKK